MIDFLSQYGMFLAETVTLVVAALLIIAAIANAAASRSRGAQDEGEIRVRNLNRYLEGIRDGVQQELLPPGARKREEKKRRKEEKQRRKQEKKGPPSEERRRPVVYVLDFEGDLRASAVDNLRREITAVLQVADKQDEVLVRLESPGGMVHGYGLAASQLDRIRGRGIRLTVCVDKVAASGGYMMACIADRIIAAPFAILGSIGVVAQIPNVHRLLKKHDIDVELMTAGEYKRTLTVFGENTVKGKEKFQQELEDTHTLFKTFVREHRRGLDIDKVATGEHWFGTRAREYGLVDEIMTSDEYLTNRTGDADVYEISWHARRKLTERLGLSFEGAVQRLLDRWVFRSNRQWWQ